MKRAKQKAVGVTLLVTLLYGYGVFGVYAAGNNPEYQEVAQRQSLYRTEIFSSRGTIYDCKLAPLTDQESRTLAVAIPTAKALTELNSIAEEPFDVEQAVREGKPVTAEVNRKKEIDGVAYFTVPRRYSAKTPQLCPHLIGYTDAYGSGVSGAELAFDELLRRESGRITVTYTADALGRMIPGEGWSFADTCSDSRAGIVLTVEKELQQALEQAVTGKLKKGAAVVVSVPDCKIRAMVSCPDFDPAAPEDSFSSPDSPLIDRALTAYAPGSVFKVVLTAAALENGIDDRERYRCTGRTFTSGLSFSCFGGWAHGEVNLSTALQKSCNCYFINLSKRISAQAMTGMALNLGLGSETALWPQLSGEQGCIPSPAALNSPRALSNFAIGQGEVTVTPLQAAALMNAIASGGVYTAPSIYEGETGNGTEITLEAPRPAGVSVMEASVARQIRRYLESAVKYGTGSAGGSSLYTAGAKTGTAETGRYENGGQLLNYWYCGYLGERDSPKYAVAVLHEGAVEGDNPTGEIFREIGEFLFANEKS